jgi:mitochondrial fission protein ELM1
MLDLWILTHRRVGDLQQMRTLATVLEARVVEKQIGFRNAQLARVMPFLSLSLMDRQGSSPLEAPWPDLVLVAEGAVGSIGLEVKRRSSGKTKVVCLGRPRGRIKEFDLIITSPQFELTPAANVLELNLPLHSLDRRALEKAANLLLPRVSHLQRPWIVLLVGGTSAPDILDESAASALAKEALSRAKQDGASLLVVTSPRTGAIAERALAKVLGEEAHLFFWSRADAENAYLGCLQLADAFIVTSDSISMATEALLTGKPLEIYRLPQKLKGVRAAAAYLARTRLKGGLAFTSGLFEVRPNRLAVLDRLHRSNVFDLELDRERAKDRVFKLLCIESGGCPPIVLPHKPPSRKS